MVGFLAVAMADVTLPVLCNRAGLMAHKKTVTNENQKLKNENYKRMPLINVVEFHARSLIKQVVTFQLLHLNFKSPIGVIKQAVTFQYLHLNFKSPIGVIKQVVTFQLLHLNFKSPIGVIKGEKYCTASDKSRSYR